MVQLRTTLDFEEAKVDGRSRRDRTASGRYRLRISLIDGCEQLRAVSSQDMLSKLRVV